MKKLTLFFENTYYIPISLFIPQFFHSQSTVNCKAKILSAIGGEQNCPSIVYLFSPLRGKTTKIAHYGNLRTITIKTTLLYTMYCTSYTSTTTPLMLVQKLEHALLQQSKSLNKQQKLDKAKVFSKEFTNFWHI